MIVEIAKVVKIVKTVMKITIPTLLLRVDHTRSGGRALTSYLHSFLYEIECNRIAEKANEVIDPVMGEGHYNLPESKFSVLMKFRPKDTNLHQMHYEVSTNMGLCQSNMTYLIKHEGSTNQWVLELFGRMGLPQIDGI